MPLKNTFCYTCHEYVGGVGNGWADKTMYEV